MTEPTEMTMKQGKCEIYPTEELQFCTRVKVLVVPLKPEEDFEWLGGDTLRNVDLTCAERGLNRLLGKIDDGVKPPTPRPRKANAAEKRGAGDGTPGDIGGAQV